MPKLFSLLLVIAFASSCSDEEDARKVIQKPSFATETGEGVTVTYTDSGVVKAKIKSPLMQHFSMSQKPYTLMPKGVEGTFFDSNKDASSFVFAGIGIYYETEKYLVMKENVKLINVKGDTLSTEYLVWDEVKEKIYTDKFVKITTPDQLIYGDGLVSNQNFTEYRITNVKGNIKLKKNE
jgi:LPS export ABC transporter protein LptC